jgi:hypothetical protein
MKHIGEFPESESNFASRDYKPQHIDHETSEAGTGFGRLSESIGHLKSQFERLGMHQAPQYYDLWRNDRRVMVYGGPLAGTPDAYRIVVNLHVDNSIDDYAEIFVDDVVTANQNLSHTFGIMPIDKETGDTGATTDETPPIIWETTQNNWFLFEGSLEHDIPELPARKDSIESLLARAQIADDLALLLQDISEVDRLEGFGT